MTGSTIPSDESFTAASQSWFTASTEEGTTLVFEEKFDHTNFYRVQAYTKIHKSHNLMAIGCTWMALIALGVVFNIFILIMMFNKELRSTSHGVLMASLAILDSFSLGLKIIPAMKLMETHISDFHIPKSKDTIWVCFVVTLMKANECASVWIVVGMAMDRILSICYPIYRIEWCTPKRAMIASVVGIGTSYLLNMFVMTYLVLSSENMRKLTVYGWVFEPMSESCGQLSYWYDTNIWLHLGCIYLLPLTILLVCSIMLVRKLRERIEQIKTIEFDESVEVIIERIKQNNRLTISFLCLFAKVGILMIPKSIFDLWYHIVYYLTVNQNTFPGIPDIYTNTNDPEYIEYEELLERSSNALIAVEIVDTLMIACYAFSLPALFFSSRYFRRTLYQVSCWKRANLDANLTHTMQRDAINNRLDPVAHSKESPDISSYSGKCSMRKEHEKRNLEIVASLEGENTKKEEASKTSSLASNKLEIQVIDLDEAQVGGEHVEVSIKADAVAQFNMKMKHELVCEMPSTESVLQCTAEKLQQFRADKERVASCTKDLKM